jgi:hypothetical protein
MTFETLRRAGGLVVLALMLCASPAHAQTTATTATTAPNYKALIRDLATQVSCEAMQSDHVATAMRTADGTMRYVLRALAISTLVSTPYSYLTPTDWHVLSLANEIQSRMKDPPLYIQAAAYVAMLGVRELLVRTRTGADAADELWVFPAMGAVTAFEGATVNVGFGMCPGIGPRADSKVSISSSNETVLSASSMSTQGSVLTLATAPYPEIGTTGTTITVNVTNARGQSATRSFMLSVVHVVPAVPAPSEEPAPQ